MCMSVTEAVKEIIVRDRSIHDCMKMNIINYTALALRILPSVEQEVGYKVNLNTVVVAIKRYADSFKEETTVYPDSDFKNVKLVMTGSIMDVILPPEFGEDTRWVKDHFANNVNYEFFKLDDTFRMLIDDMDDIRSFIDNMSKERVYHAGLAKIKIHVANNENKSQIISHVIEILHRSNIEINNVFFGQDGITLVLNELIASKAYEILRTKIMK